MTAKLLIALVLAALVAGENRAQALEMQVEEPAPANPPIDPDLESGQWRGNPAEPGLNKAQRTAYEQRRRQVEAMASEIRRKREALLNSAPVDRAARAKELEQLVLEPSRGSALDAAPLDKLENRLEKQAEAKAKSLEKKREKQAGKAENSIDKKQEKLDRELDALGKQRKPVKGKPGK